MPWCEHCGDDTPFERDPSGMGCCTLCGKILDGESDLLTDGVAFEKTSNGQSRFTGVYERMSEYSVSRDRTLNKGRDKIHDIVIGLEMDESITGPANNLYKIAVERNFTKGRCTSQIAAACLYIACRQDLRPYLLIDFSNHLLINVYMLGAVFLQLCKLLSLEEHPIIQKPIDPSLYLTRFTNALLKSETNNKEVTTTALNIIASMKRDWMQTGRKPSGLCGAALYIAAHSHQFRCTKADIAKAVYVCENTLTKRLMEFEDTECANLTAEELDEMAKDLRQKSLEELPQSALNKKSTIEKLLCQHKDGYEPHYAHGLCKKCYDEFVELSGGLQGGLEPPAFQRAEMLRKAEAEKNDKASDLEAISCEDETEHSNKRKEVCFSSSPSENGRELPTLKEPGSIGSAGSPKNVKSANLRSSFSENAFETAVEESESLSDIDDFEVDGYLHTEEEKHYKKIIWEEMNREYLEELAVKEAAEAAAREAYIARFANCPDDIRSAQELAAAAAEAVAKSRKEKRQKKAEEAKNMPPAKNAAESISQYLKRKTFSSRINYDVLNKLYSTDQENEKKQRVEPKTNNKYDEEDDGVDSTVADDFNDNHENAADPAFYEDDYGGGGYDGGNYDYGNDDDFDYY